MKPMKSAFACLAATGLLLSQPAAAASAVRSGSATQDSENLAGAGAALPAIIAILAVAIIAVVSASSDDDNPVSP